MSMTPSTSQAPGYRQKIQGQRSDYDSPFAGRCQATFGGTIEDEAPPVIPSYDPQLPVYSNCI